ncbi:hypothetical protein CLCR_09246 [Cladophialophora carrionii]|uniref:Uncharacterized protein n=1 Tax=Cladophialophora carrionii TaxID=86049 RepID=A0A1C1CUR2_9EURO|nr:hypothetical protein CLCR_09246 [Cladophialophora carrionii]
MPLKAAEIISHPAFDTVEWELPPTKKGHAEVAKGRAGGPFKLYYEIHGQGHVKLVVGAFKILEPLVTLCATKRAGSCGRSAEEEVPEDEASSSRGRDLNGPLATNALRLAVALDAFLARCGCCRSCESTPAPAAAIFLPLSL